MALIRRTLALPFAALLTAQAVVAVAALMASEGPFRGRSFARWDSFNYISIATRGYVLEEEQGRVVGGNVAWFPGYPLLVRALASRHLTPAKAGTIVSLLFALGLLAALWTVLDRDGDPPKDPTSLLLAALFPGFVYVHAVFPIAMVAALCAFSVLLWSRERYLAAGCVGAAAAFTYPPGFLVGGALLFDILRERGRTAGDRWRNVLRGPVLVAGGLGAVFAYQATQVGGDAFLRMRRDYFDNALSNPFASFAENTRLAWAGLAQPEALPHWQTLLVAALMVLSVAVAWRERHALGRAEEMLLSAAILFWAFPYFLGRGISPYRGEALVVGIVPVLARLPPFLRVLLLVCFASLGTGMCVLFFQNVLV